MTFYELEVEKVKQETADTKSIYFTIPKELKRDFDYAGGQYITISAMINGSEVRRSYSLSSAPYEQEFRIGVKRVEQGLMSNYLHDNIDQGALVKVSKPEGKFIHEISEDSRSHYFICAGSGITPVLSIVKSVLENEPQSFCYLLYGSRDEKSIIYLEELNKLENKYEGQIVIRHSLSQPLKSKPAGIRGLFSKSKESWQGLRGRIDEMKIKEFINDNPERNKNVFYLCGPGSLIRSAEGLLKAMNIQGSTILKELFTIDKEDVQEVKAVDSGKIKVKYKDKWFEVSIGKDKSILDMLLEEKIDVPYSCTSGACSTCVAKVKEGAAEMEVCYALNENEVSEGLILTCQAKPTSNILEIDFDI